MTMAGGIKGYIASEGCVKGYMRMLLTSPAQIHLLLTFVSPNAYVDKGYQALPGSVNDSMTLTDSIKG